MPEVVNQHVVGVVVEARALLEERVVSGQAAVEVGLRDLWTPDRKQAVAPRIGIVKQGTFPFVTTTGRSRQNKERTDCRTTTTGQNQNYYPSNIVYMATNNP